MGNVLPWPSASVVTKLNGFKISKATNVAEKTTSFTVKVSAKIAENNDLSTIGKLYISLEDYKNENSSGSRVQYKNTSDLAKNTPSSCQLMIYLDGMLYDKDVYLNEDCNTFVDQNGRIIYINEIVSNDIKLYQDGTIYGTIVVKGSSDTLGVVAYSKGSSHEVEIHNVKPLSPILSKFSLEFADSALSALAPDGYLQVDNNVWARTVLLNNKTLSFGSNSDDLNNPFFSLWDAIDDIHIKNEVECKYGENGEFLGWNVEMRIQGLKKFESASYRYYLDNVKEVKLSSQALLNDYKQLENAMKPGYTIDNYVYDAKINDVVTSGFLKVDANVVRTAPLSFTANVGNYKYKYNPISDNNFQLEVVSKNGSSMVKNLYYVNLPVDRWYNMTLYSVLSGSQPTSNETTQYNSTKRFGLQLTDITADNIEDVPSKSKEIFSVYTSDSKITDGANFTSGSLALSEINGIFKEISDTKGAEFDPCSRSAWNCKFTSDAKYAYNDDASFEEYSKNTRKNRDLFWIGETLDGFAPGNIKKNSVKLFDNAGAYSVLSGINKFKVKEISGYVPRKISVNDTEKYVLMKKDDTYHMMPISGMCVKSIMLVNTPNLSKYASGTKYYDTYRDSLLKLKEYMAYFADNGHKLPQVNYTHKILDSDYATLVYNSCEKKDSFKNISKVDGDYSSQSIINSYDKDPTTIAYVWDNSQVTRNESCQISETGELFDQDSKLYWSENKSNESVVEVGSMYNFKDSASVKNIVKIDVSSVNQRQTALMPVLGSPFDYVKKNDENGIVIVNDTIIATAALGYNSNGYPMNSMMIYNGKDAVKIDPTHTTYLYVSQNDDKNDCKFGATQEKPIYVDMPEINFMSQDEEYDFLPNPSFTTRRSTESYDTSRVTATGGDNENGFSAIDVISPTAYMGKASSDVSNTKTVGYETIDIITRWSIYDYRTNNVNIIDSNDKLNAGNGISVSFAGNITSFAVNAEGQIQKKGLNVFFDIGDWEDVVNKDYDSRCLSTLNCYDYDGNMIDFSNAENKESIQTILKLDNSTNIDTKNDAIQDFLTQSGSVCILEPTLFVKWLDTSISVNSWANYENDIKADISRDTEIALFDNYKSVNLTGVRFLVKKEHFSNAPVKIEFRFLKRVKKDNDQVGLAWVYDSRYDFDISETFEDEYDLKSNSDKYFNHVFPVFTDSADLTKHVYGLAITIKQIVPQMENGQPAVIDEIKVYCGNMLNDYSQAYSVKDTFVRKNEANCRNFYDFKVNEYVWNLPNSLQEWKTLSSILEDDVSNNRYKFITENLFNSISGALSSLTNPSKDAELSTRLAASTDVAYNSLDASYYITKSDGSTQLNDILSDNYLSDHENMTITWKYVDYVYIYYEAYSTHARQLLKKYFGSHIYNALKNKLNANIDSMNANSAFKDKFRFTGGIAVVKFEDMLLKRNSTVFKWQSKNEVKNDWTEVHTTTQYDTYGTQTLTTTGNLYTTEWHNDNAHSTWRSGTYTDVTKNENKLYSTEKIETVKAELRDQTAISTAKVVVQNPNYVSAEAWLNSFSPVEIKYRID